MKTHKKKNMNKVLIDGIDVANTVLNISATVECVTMLVVVEEGPNSIVDLVDGNKPLTFSYTEDQLTLLSVVFNHSSYKSSTMYHLLNLNIVEVKLHNDNT